MRMTDYEKERMFIMNKDEIKNYLNILKYSTMGSYIDAEKIFKNAEFFFERVMYAAENIFTSVEIKMLYGHNSNWLMPTLSIHPIEPNEAENKGGYEILIHMWSYYDTRTTCDHKQINPEISLCELSPDGSVAGDGWYGIDVVVDKDGYNIKGSFKRRYFTQNKEFILVDNFDKIKRFIALIKSSVTISKTIAWAHSVCPEPEEYEYIRYRKWLEETTIKIISDIDIKLKSALGHSLKRVFNNDPEDVNEETDIISYEFEIGDRLFHFYLGTNLRYSIHDEDDWEPYAQINIGIEEWIYDRAWGRYEIDILTMADYFVDRDKKIHFTPWEKSDYCELSDDEINDLFGNILKAIGPLEEENNE